MPICSWDGGLLRALCNGFLGSLAVQDRHAGTGLQFVLPIHDDALGRQMKEILARRAREGVRVYVLFDEIGSHDLPAAYKD